MAILKNILFPNNIKEKEMKYLKHLFFISLFSIVIISCSKNGFKDERDGKVYKTVLIGNQVWMAENLNFDVGEGSWYYDENASNGSRYGRLYTIESAKKAVPKGWHLPTEKEWLQLLEYMDEKEKIEKVSIFDQMVSNNEFNAFLAGYLMNKRNIRGKDKLVSVGMGNITGFWSSSENKKEPGLCFCSIDAQDKKVAVSGTLHWGIVALYVRLIKDN